MAKIVSSDNTVSVYQMKPVRGQGAVMTDSRGKKYIDLFAGIAVNLLGYNHPAVNAAAIKQIKKYIHTSRLFYGGEQEKLAASIMKNSFGKVVYFVNTGAEANEGAFKLARKWGMNKKKGAYKIVSFGNSFHGRTLAALSATGQKKFHEILNPKSPGFIHAKFNDIKDVAKKIDAKTCAVILEPIQAEGGVNVADKKFLKALRALCTKKKALLIFDEVQTGMGRTGTLFAYQGCGVTPDIMTLGKGIGGGFPLSAVVVSQKLKDVFKPGDHGTTMGANAVACAAGNAVMNVVSKKPFLKAVAKKGEYFMKKIREIESKKIKEVRGKGFLIGVELTEPAAPYVAKALKAGLIINSPKPKVLRLVPPLVLSKQQIDKSVKVLDKILI